MKNLKASVLSAAIAAAVAATSAQAAEVVTVDPSLTLTYKNYFWLEEKAGSNQEVNQKENAYERKEWAHGVVADFDTGYVNDMLGVVVTAGFADAIGHADGASNVASGSKGNGVNIGGFQQAYVKGKYSFGELNLNGSIGVKKRGTELYGNSGSRILAASSEGFDLSAEIAGLNLYGTQITGASDRNDSAFSNKLTNGSEAQPQKIDHINIVGANYSIAGVDLAAEYLKSDDYLKKTFLKAGYSLKLAEDMSVDFDARYGKAQDAGNLYGSDNDQGTSNDESDDTFDVNRDYKSTYYNLNATLNAGNAYATVGYNRTKDGAWDAGSAAEGNDGTFNSSLSQWEDYSLEGEKAYLLGAGYNFADQGLAGLNVDAWYAKGTDAKDVQNFKRREYGTKISYAFSGQLEGLSLAWLHVNYRADGQDKNGDAVGGLYDENVNRVYLKYSVSVF